MDIFYLLFRKLNRLCLQLELLYLLIFILMILYPILTTIIISLIIDPNSTRIYPINPPLPHKPDNHLRNIQTNPKIPYKNAKTYKTTAFQTNNRLIIDTASDQ